MLLILLLALPLFTILWNNLEHLSPLISINCLISVSNRSLGPLMLPLALVLPHASDHNLQQLSCLPLHFIEFQKLPFLQLYPMFHCANLRLAHSLIFEFKILSFLKRIYYGFPSTLSSSHHSFIRVNNSSSSNQNSLKRKGIACGSTRLLKYKQPMV